MLLAAMILAPVGWLAADLDQCVRRHAVQAGEKAQQGQVDQHTPVGGLREEGIDAHDVGSGQAPGCEIQVDGEDAHADGAKRHQADFHMTSAQDLAQERAGSDADGEHHQQEGRHMFVAMQNVLGKAGELAQKYCAEEPHPADPQQRAEHYQVAVRQLEVAKCLRERIPVDFQAGVGGRRCRHVLREQPAGHRHCQAGYRDALVPDLGNRHDQAAGQVAQQDRNESAHFDYAVAAGEFAFAQHLGQKGVFYRTEQGRM